MRGSDVLVPLNWNCKLYELFSPRAPLFIDKGLLLCSAENADTYCTHAFMDSKFILARRETMFDIFQN